MWGDLGGRAGFPEGLPATAELTAAQGDDGVGATDGPAHPGLFEPAAGDGLAAGLDDSRPHEEPLFSEVGVTHAVSVGLEVGDAPAQFVLLGGGAGAETVHARDDRLDVAGVQFDDAEIGPGLGLGCAGAVEDLGEFAEVFASVVEIDDLDGAREVLVGEIPDPQGAVAEDDGLLGAPAAATDGLGEDATCELLGGFDGADVLERSPRVDRVYY
jgi:hypothetical protein